MKNTTNYGKNALYAIAASAFIFGASACNNTPKAEDSKEVAEEHNEAKFDDNKKEKDAEFLVDAAEISLEEIQLGQLAQSRSKNTDVIALGKMMETEHTKSFNELKGLAEKKQITIPASLTEDGQEAFKKLNDKTGNDFDKEYCSMMIKGHKDAIDKFEKASRDSEDTDIRTWAGMMLPGLRTHLDHAETCQKTVK
jgi:putative membrane protein